MKNQLQTKFLRHFLFNDGTQWRFLSTKQEAQVRYPLRSKFLYIYNIFFDIFIISSLQTHEEAIADLLVDAGPISYKQLPFTLYQVQKYLYFFLRLMLYHVSHVQQGRHREPSVKTLFIYSIYFPKWESIPQPSL